MIVLFGATGDLARRKLLPGLFHLAQAGLVPEYRIVGTSLDELDDDGFRDFARRSLDEFARHGLSEETWAAFENNLSFVRQSEGPEAPMPSTSSSPPTRGGSRSSEPDGHPRETDVDDEGSDGVGGCRRHRGPVPWQPATAFQRPAGTR